MREDWKEKEGGGGEEPPTFIIRAAEAATGFLKSPSIPFHICAPVHGFDALHNIMP